MGGSPGEYASAFDAAVRSFWEGRAGQQQAQTDSGTSDAGTRGSVTGGKHLDAIADVVRTVFADNLEGATFSSGRAATLPGYYRQAKNWDLVVQYEGHVVAAVELKSQVGSFGNNFNNRVEEAIGQAVDFWTAHNEGLIPGARPWFGYLMLAEESPRSIQPQARPPAALYATDPTLGGLSYIERYQAAFERMLSDGTLSGACLAVSRKNSTSASFPSAALSFGHLTTLISNRCREVLSLVRGDSPHGGGDTGR